MRNYRCPADDPREAWHMREEERAKKEVARQAASDAKKKALLEAKIKSKTKEFDDLDKVITKLQKGFNGTKSAKEEELLSRKIDRLANKLQKIDDTLSELHFAKDHLRETSVIRR